MDTLVKTCRPSGAKMLSFSTQASQAQPGLTREGFQEVYLPTSFTLDLYNYLGRGVKQMLVSIQIR